MNPYLIFAIVLAMSANTARAQSQAKFVELPSTSHVLTPATYESTNPNEVDTTTQYDFWEGDWEVSWDEGDGKIGRGTNRISRILGGKALQEDFHINEGQSKGFIGSSISAIDAKTKLWKQTWMDNAGGHFNFIGGYVDDQPMFATEMIIKDTFQVQQRMRFKNITYDSFTWDWEGTNDGGKNWKLLWQINYVRQKIKASDAAVSDFAPMIGICDCESFNLDKNGEWKEPIDLEWSFKYIMEGRGVQDEFKMQNGISGGSIRQYDEENKNWYVHYYATNSMTSKLQSWTGKKEKNKILLHSPQKSKTGEDGFLKLTFHNISDKGFDWIGAWVNDDESVKKPFWKISCKKRM